MGNNAELRLSLEWLDVARVVAVICHLFPVVGCDIVPEVDGHIDSWASWIAARAQMALVSSL
jgi:hypothetical protein